MTHHTATQEGRRMKGAVTFRHPPEVRARAMELREAGLRTVDIAKEMGLRPGTIHRLLTREPAPPPLDYEAIRAKVDPLLDAGMTQRQIMKVVGISKHAFSTIVGRTGRHRLVYNAMMDRAKRIDAMLLAGDAARDIAASIGCTVNAVTKRRHRLVSVGKLAPPDRKVADPMEAEGRRQMAVMRLEGKSWAAIAEVFGLRITQVKMHLRKAYAADPTLRPAKPKKYASPQERERARNERRKKAAAEERARNPRPMVPRPEKPRPVVAAPKIVPPHKYRVEPDSKRDREAEQRAIEAAIAAGIGKRFEIERMAPGRQIQTCQHAVEYLKGRGLEVEVDRASSTHPKYRVTGGTSFDGRWMLPSPFVTAVRAFAAETTYRVIPLNEAYAQQMGA